MVDQTQRLSRYRELIQELNETKKMEIARRTVELFFSFDIVNSSLYKTINYTGWYNVIISLFKEIQASVMKLMPGAEMWRVLGDDAYSARTAHPFQRNGAPFRFKLSKAQQVD